MSPFIAHRFNLRAEAGELAEFRVTSDPTCQADPVARRVEAGIVYAQGRWADVCPPLED